jgi:hypothetical protein
VHQNSYLDFPTAVVISLSRCDFPAVISAQKKSADTVCPSNESEREEEVLGSFFKLTERENRSVNFYIISDFITIRES